MTKPHTLSRLAVVTMILGASALAAAQVRMPAPAQRVRSAPLQPARLTGSPTLEGPGAFVPMRGGASGGMVYGVVQNHLGVLVPDAGLVLLRNLVTGEVVAEARVNGLAQFSFRGLPNGLYTAELVGASGAVIASTPAFTAATGEVIQLSQTIPSLPIHAFGRLTSSATSSALTSAASSGVLAVAAGVPVSPGS